MSESRLIQQWQDAIAFGDTSRPNYSEYQQRQQAVENHRCEFVIAASKINSTMRQAALSSDLPELERLSKELVDLGIEYKFPHVFSLLVELPSSYRLIRGQTLLQHLTNLTLTSPEAWDLYKAYEADSSYFQFPPQQRR